MDRQLQMREHQKSISHKTTTKRNYVSSTSTSAASAIHLRFGPLFLLCSAGSAYPEFKAHKQHIGDSYGSRYASESYGLLLPKRRKALPSVFHAHSFEHNRPRHFLTVSEDRCGILNGASALPPLLPSSRACHSGAPTGACSSLFFCYLVYPSRRQMMA